MTDVINVVFQDPEILETQSNIILTAIVNGMKKDETRYVLWRNHRSRHTPNGATQRCLEG